MDLTVYNTDMQALGIIDQITSLLWTRRYWAPGEFRLLVPFTRGHMDLLRRGNLIMRRGDDEAAQILYIGLQADEQGGEALEVQGRFLPAWLGKRIVMGQVVTRDIAYNIIRMLVNVNMLATASTERRIPRLVLDDDPPIPGNAVDYTSDEFANVLQEVSTLARAEGLGFRFSTDVRSGLHAFHVYAGVDRSTAQADRTPCVFSTQYNNIRTQTYTASDENHKTAAFVTGEQEEVRTVVELGAAISGLDRSEVYIGATDIKRKYKAENGQEITRSEPEYQAALAARGRAELAARGTIETFDSVINPRVQYIYRQDYDVGDVVTCVNRTWGIQAHARITEVTETYQAGADDVAITFGDGLPTPYEAIRRIARGG